MAGYTHLHTLSHIQPTSGGKQLRSERAVIVLLFTKIWIQNGHVMTVMLCMCVTVVSVPVDSSKPPKLWLTAGKHTGHDVISLVFIARWKHSWLLDTTALLNTFYWCCMANYETSHLLKYHCLGCSITHTWDIFWHTFLCKIAMF